MKYNFTFSLALFLCFSITLLAQDKEYMITGSVKKYPSGAMAYLQYKGLTGIVKDSVSIVGGNFAFKGKIDEPRPASISIHEPNKKTTAQNHVNFFLEPGNLMVAGKQMLYNAIITGSPATSDKKDFDKLMAGQRFTQPGKVTVTQTTRVVAVPAGSMPPSGTMSQGRGGPASGTLVSQRTINDINDLPYEVQSAIREMNEQGKEKAVQFIKDHPNSFVSMYALNSLWVAKRITYLEYVSISNALAQALMQSNEGKVMFVQ
ncbi:DUF4369 domain-containing protein [Daejeonella sp.]|uniref:DUF4369 domain-containing protein n=1 Tax=Daejeonella sp. TaxID=2805397 RepID=UPI0030BC14F1